MGAIGATFLAFSNYFRDQFYKCRLMVIAHNIFWGVFLGIVGSYAGVITLFMILISNVIGTYRYYWRQKSVV